MRRCHAGARQRLRRVITQIAEGQDVHAGRVDVDDRPVVREAREVIGFIRCADGARIRHARGGCGRCVLAVIPRGDGDEEARVGGGLDRGVERVRLAAAEGEVGDCFADAVFRFCVVDGPVDAAEDGGDGAGAVGAEDFDGDEGRVFGDAVGRGADGAGDVGAVAVVVGGDGGDLVGAPDGAAVEVLVCGADALQWLGGCLKGDGECCRRGIRVLIIVVQCGILCLNLGHPVDWILRFEMITKEINSQYQ